MADGRITLTEEVMGVRLETIGDYEVAIGYNEEDLEAEKECLEEGLIELDDAKAKVSDAQREIKRLEALIPKQKTELEQLRSADSH